MVSADTQRLWDLVRHQRAELHQEGLISDVEYGLLASDSKAVSRLEKYDEMRSTLSDLTERAERARRILKESGGNWGMLDTSRAREVLA